MEISNKKQKSFIFDKIEDFCKTHNLNFTANRKEVLSIIVESSSPIKAYDILEIMNSEAKKIEPPVIYRALEFLEKNGFIHKINSNSSYLPCLHFEHHHSCQIFICKLCHESSEICSDLIGQEIMNQAESKNFKIEKIFIEVLGLCEKCR